MAVINMKALLETGVHFGHRTRKWDPRMKPYIFTERNGIHIIDLQQTQEALEEVYALVRKTAASGGTVLFVGTKRQAQETIDLEANRCEMPYVNARWLGGTLTNWRTISSRIRELENLERQRDEGIFDLLTKKEALNMNREIEKLNKRLGGIRIMTGLPDLLFTVDVAREETAIHEANLLDIPVIAMVDTNCDPTGVDYIIPSNDDAIRAIKLVTSIIADAVLEGRAMRKDEEVEAEVAEEAELAAEVEMRDEDLLGEATLAKLKSGEYDEKSAQAEAESEESEEETEASEAEEDRAEPEAEVEEEAAEEEPETGEAEEEEEKTEAKAAQSAAEGSQAEPDEEAEGEEADQEDESPNDEQEAEGKEA